MFLHLGPLINQTLKLPQGKLSSRGEDAIKGKNVQSFWLSSSLSVNIKENII